MRPKFANSSISTIEVIINSILVEFDQKKQFFWGVVLVPVHNLRLALGMALKFYTSVAKWLKLKVKKFLGLIPTFVEVTGEKLVGCLFGPPDSE